MTTVLKVAGSAVLALLVAVLILWALVSNRESSLTPPDVGGWMPASTLPEGLDPPEPPADE